MDPRSRRTPRVRRRWPGLAPILGLGLAALVILVLPRLRSRPQPQPQPRRSPAASSHSTARPAQVAAGRWPAARYSPASPPPAWSGPLPYPVLIADEGNDRMIEVAPNKRIVWRFPPQAHGGGAKTHGVPGDDAFFGPHGRSITTNDEDQGTIVRVSYDTRKVIWFFGVKGQLGGGLHHLNYPDDAYLLPDGNTIVADIKNCRELTISPSAKIIRSWGRPQTGYCRTDPRHGLYGYPNGDTPQPNGDILMSFISGDKIALLSPQGQVIWEATSPDLYGGYVSDPQLLPNGNVLVAGYGKPGALVIFNPHTGAVVWQYHVTSGPGELDHPSFATMLSNGNVLLNDDYNHRVIVIDPHTNRIVWQYGHTGVAGRAYGYLHQPDGVDVDYWRNWQGWQKTHPAASPQKGTSL